MKNILYLKDSTHVFTDYGIEIPLLNERVMEVVDYYKLTSKTLNPIEIDDLKLAHDEQFIEALENSPKDLVLKTYELQSSDGSYHRYNPKNATYPLVELIRKARVHVAGTFYAAKKSLETSFYYHLGGGMHHAMSMRPGGFCMFNDIVISIRKLQKEKMIKKAAIIDLDCHKGDGTAQITHGDESIKTFSIHMKNGWPLDDPSNKLSFTPSDVDVPIENFDDYNKKLKEALDKFSLDGVDLVLVVHGVDVWEMDALESSNKIKLNKKEILERDLYVYNFIKNSKLPQAWCLGGGYGKGVSDLYIQFLNSIG